MATKPANPKLWAIITAQARAKFATYPSPAASHWVHKQYVDHGGQFVETSDKTKHSKEQRKKFEAGKRKDLEKKKELEKKKGKDKD